MAAARAFLSSMRRDYARKHPGKENVVLNLEDYTPTDQRRYLTAMGHALKASDAV